MAGSEYDIVIIGGGLGGLQCGYILAKKGLNVCIIEKEPQTGGCLQTFKRGGCLFDTGFHYVGGLQKGQSLHRLFDYFNLLDLPWHSMDAGGFDEVIWENDSYMFANGHQCFAETLASKFPHQQKQLEAYTGFLKSVGESTFHAFDRKEDASHELESSLFAQSAYTFMNHIFDDPKLINILSGTSLKLHLNPDKLPLYTFAQINESYIGSAWRIKGGGSLVTERLTHEIISMGGTVIKGCKVTSLSEQDGKIVKAILTNGEEIHGRFFISNIHPAATIGLIKESKKIRPIYRKRINGLRNSFGMFTVNIKLKKNRLTYLNRNIHIHTGQDAWSYHTYVPNRKDSYIMVSYMVPEAGNYAESIDILTPMYWEEVSKWDGTRPGRRDNEYLALKEQKAEACIALASQHIPGLKEAVDKIYTSTPLTYKDYTGTPNGSAYGIEKDYNEPMYTVITPKTPVSNLFLTGQNLNVHGVLGVSMTSFLTCKEIIHLTTEI